MKKSLVIGLLAALLGLGLAQTELAATADMGGIPEGVEEAVWQEAAGSAEIVAEADGEYTVALQASGLIPDGLYTTWYIIPGVAGTAAGQEVGPAGALPNEFRADADGQASFEFSVPSDNEYQDLVVAYHSDDMSHGEEPGAMGEVTFGQLAAAFPNPAE